MRSERHHSDLQKLRAQIGNDLFDRACADSLAGQPLDANEENAVQRMAEFAWREASASLAESVSRSAALFDICPAFWLAEQAVARLPDMSPLERSNLWRWCTRELERGGIHRERFEAVLGGSVLGRMGPEWAIPDEARARL